MDVSKLFAKSPEQGKEMKDTGPLRKQKLSSVRTPEEDNFEDEGGWIAPSEEDIDIIGSDVWDVGIHPLYQKYNGLVLEVTKLRDRKGKDYGSDEDPFANVRGAQEFGVRPWIGAANSANDCMTRIKQYAKTGTLENESVRDSMLDLVNYGLIMLTLWEEENES